MLLSTDGVKSSETARAVFIRTNKVQTALHRLQYMSYVCRAQRSPFSDKLSIGCTRRQPPYVKVSTCTRQIECHKASGMCLGRTAIRSHQGCNAPGPDWESHSFSRRFPRTLVGFLHFDIQSIAGRNQFASTPGGAIAMLCFQSERPGALRVPWPHVRPNPYSRVNTTYHGKITCHVTRATIFVFTLHIGFK